MKGRIVFILAFMLAAVGAGAQIHSLTFARMDASDGLNDNLVQHIMQLPDGRMAITTRGNINIFDGAEFRYIHADNEHVGALREYNGAYHVYVDKDERLWVKEWQKLRCFDLRHNRYVSNFDSLFRSVGIADEVTDLFIDSDKKMWVVPPRAVVNTTDGVSIARQAGDATLQDLETSGGKDYLSNKLGRPVRDVPKRTTKMNSHAYSSTLGLMDLIIDTIEQQHQPSAGFGGAVKDFFRSLLGG